MEENNTQQSNNEQNIVKNDNTQVEKNVNQDKQVPYDRFSEVNNAKKDLANQVTELQSQLNDIQNKQKAARDKELEKQGEYKKLLEERDAEMNKLRSQNETANEYMQQRQGMLMDGLTDEQKEIADGMSLAKLEKFVKMQNANIAGSVPTNKLRAGSTTGDFGGFASYAEWAQKDPEGYEKANGPVNIHGNPNG